MVLTGLLLLIGAAVGGEAGLIIAVILVLAMNFGAYWFSDKIALSMAHAQPITADDDPELYQLVAEQARLANMPMPKVYEIDEPSPNAFATGRNPQNATVAVTTGIRRILTREELAGVMAHEMAHVGNRDTLIMTVVATKVNRDTAPTVNGAVIMAVNAHASGCTPATTRSKTRVTATNAARSARKPRPPRPIRIVQR